jgi:dihydrofolate synthase / folylpolyglutamate synthase
MTYTETIEYLYSRLPVFHREGKSAYNPGLKNIESLCKYLGNPEKKFKSIHIAGTNGKGSTSHFLASIFQSAGYKTGLYTSPHLKSFTERIRINGIEIPEQNVIDFVKEHKAFTEELSPSFFELTVSMAFDYFANEKVDIAIIEVGLGGRLDSTNIIVPELSIITNIGYDHTDLLGNTLPEIAFEKAGIIKPNIPVVIGTRHPETEKVFIEKSIQNKSDIYFAEDNYTFVCSEIFEGKLKADFIDNTTSHEFSLFSQLIGQYQLYNLKTVLTSCKILNLLGWNLPTKFIREGVTSVVSKTGLKGRWQILNTNPMIVCDTAHNEHGFKEVLSQISSYHFRELHFVLGFVRDKDFMKIVKMLPLKSKISFCETSNPRTIKMQEFSDKVQKSGVKVEYFKDVNAAILSLKGFVERDDFIYIGGSNFVVAEIENL